MTKASFIKLSLLSAHQAKRSSSKTQFCANLNIRYPLSVIRYLLSVIRFWYNHSVLCLWEVLA